MKTLLRIILSTLLIFTVIWAITTQPVWVEANSTSTPDVSVEQLKTHVEMLANTLPARAGEEKSLQPTLEWIEQQIKPYGKSYRQSYKVGDETFHNVLLNFGTSSKKYISNEIIIVGAHYDTAHGYPGADDNGSGVAALIELAGLLSNVESKLKTPVQLVFYTLEEPPYFRSDKMGSFIHAAALNQQKKKVKLMIALDMIGYFSDEENSQHFPFPLMDKAYSNKGNFIAVVGNLGNISAVRRVKKSMMSATDLPVYSINAPPFIQGIDFSDHLNFWYYDYPAVLITDTSFMRNLAYHKKQDTADRLDYGRMAEVVKSLYQAVIDAAR